MDQNQKMLETIVENARLGADACDQLLKKCKDAQMRKELMLERDQFNAAGRDAEERLFAMGVHPHPKGPMARMSMWMGMEMNTMMDHSAGHIAQMLIEGCTMGIVEMNKARNSLKDADGDVTGIASRLVECQQAAIERLKPFLCQKDMVK